LSSGISDKEEREGGGEWIETGIPALIRGTIGLEKRLVKWSLYHRSATLVQLCNMIGSVYLSFPRFTCVDKKKKISG